MLATLLSPLVKLISAVLVVAALVGYIMILRADLRAVKAQLGACAGQTEQLEQDLRDQNDEVNQMIQDQKRKIESAQKQLQKDRESASARIATIHKAVVPNRCEDAIKWANSYGPLLSDWSR